MEQYKEIKVVRNTCPRCKVEEMYRHRFKYPDEGHMACLPCRRKQEEAEYPSPVDIEFTYEEVVLLHQMVGGYIHTEKNCGSGVSSDEQLLHLKLGEYLHG